MSKIWKDMVQTRISIEREYVENILQFIMHPSSDDYKHMNLLRVLEKNHMGNYTEDFCGFVVWFCDTLRIADKADIAMEFLNATDCIRREVFK